MYNVTYQNRPKGKRSNSAINSHFEVSFTCLDETFLATTGNTMSTNANQTFQGHGKKFSSPSNGFLWYTEPATIHLNHHALYLSTDNRNGLAAFSSSHSLPAIQLCCVQSLIITLSESLYIINGK